MVNKEAEVFNVDGCQRMVGWCNYYKHQMGQKDSQLSIVVNQVATKLPSSDLQSQALSLLAFLRTQNGVI